MNLDKIASILDALSDKDTITIFNTIARQETSLNKLKKMKIGLSQKQYYTRTGRLLKLGLLKRKSGRISLTSFGKITYKFMTDLGLAIESISKLKALDIIMSSAELEEQHKSQLANSIFANSKLEGLLPQIR